MVLAGRLGTVAAVPQVRHLHAGPVRRPGVGRPAGGDPDPGQPLHCRRGAATQHRLPAHRLGVSTEARVLVNMFVCFVLFL